MIAAFADLEVGVVPRGELDSLWWQQVDERVMSRVMPALLTSTSTEPTSLATCATQATHESQSTTSHG